MSLPLSRILFHSSATAVMIYGYNSLHSLPIVLNLHSLPIDRFISQQYGGHVQYLTIQGLFIACAASLSSLLLDFYPSVPALKSLKRVLLLVAMPVTVVITSIYWPLLLFARQLILSKELNVDTLVQEAMQLPLRIDLALHAAPAVTLLSDFLLFERKYNKNELRYAAPMVCSVYTVCYSWWVERCATFNDGKFPYPFLTDNPFEIRVAIYMAAGTLALTSFWMINKLHS